jgi:hypothetical protein
VTCGDINDAEPAVTQPDVGLNKQTFIVGTTMRDHVAHALQARTINSAQGFAGNGYSVYPTHNLQLDTIYLDSTTISTPTRHDIISFLLPLDNPPAGNTERRPV